ncbi:MAG TPA: MgtC/SapB family protein [Herpetosiphonaceae bacterium]|nr:MgtC/SapB family protein [Herpetosiphonaceae bacterium]
MTEPEMTPVFILLRLLLAGAIGGAFGYERHEHGQPKALGVAGMMLVTIGSATYMLFAQYEAVRDPSIVGRTIQSILQGIGFLAGAVIFKGGTSVQGIKTATTIWIASAVGLATATDFWWLGLVVGVATFVILFLTDLSSHRGRQAEDAGSHGVSNE